MRSKPIVSHSHCDIYLHGELCILRYITKIYDLAEHAKGSLETVIPRSKISHGFAMPEVYATQAYAAQAVPLTGVLGSAQLGVYAVFALEYKAGT